jgi:hypothetical protein
MLPRTVFVAAGTGDNGRARVVQLCARGVRAGDVPRIRRGTPVTPV